ncbi:uncharacterized protein LOC135437449 [Drosophila montana]|uniref:uncharacterized protein LOC135437449 n=1 Tax=Drosophila montana TaxID=40370 RepID=UPI00313BFED0
MSKDPATTRIPRLDGISRIPPPGSFGGTTSASATSHIRPPTVKSTTQIFRAPAAPANVKARPISSYHPAAAPLHDLGASIKKSASGERLNNAVSLISKRTTNVLKKYFGQGKMMGASVGGIQGAAASSLMTSSLPHTPLPAAKQPQQQQQQQRQQQCLLTSSTPMPLMRSETFVCDEEEQQLREREPEGEQSQMQLTLSATPNRTRLENTRLSSVGFGRTLDLDATLIESSSPLSRTRTVIVDKKEQPELDPNATKLVSPLSVTRLATSSAQADRTRPVIPASDEPADATHLLGNLSGERADRTRPVIPAKGDSTEQLDTTQLLANLSCFRADRTRPVVSGPEAADRTRTINAAGSEPSHELNLDLTRSMEKLPLLEHMSMPSGLDLLMNGIKSDLPLETELDNTELDVTLTALAPDKSTMKLPLNSTINTERLLDISGLQSPARHIQLLNLTREFLEQTPQRCAGGRSMPQHSLVCLTPQSATTTPHGVGRYQQTPVPVHLLSPLLKAARSDLVLPTRTPEGELLPPHLVDATLGSAVQLRTPRTRYSFGLELQETTLDSSMELVDNSFSASQQQLQQLQQQLLKKQHSFDLDESLGILTPDQMKEFLDSSSQHNNNNSNNPNLSHQLELQLVAAAAQQQQQQRQQQQQQQQHLQLQQQLRLEQTPSPEELPLDPIEPQLSAALAAPAPAVAAAVVVAAPAAAPKLSNSFITSVTSVTSLDTGYQGDGEMSRPASRGACDHSPSNGPHLGRVSRQPSFPPMPAAPAAPMRRQDPMTDSDFFTESDADDVLQRGDRRAQVIDGQLYGPAMQPSASVPQLEDSCMESSGIFTDVENRCDEEMRLPELELDMEMEMDMSPDESTQTLRKAQGQAQRAEQQQSQSQPRPLSSSSAATTLSNRTSYCSVDGGSAKSFCDEAFNASSDQQQQQPQRSSVQCAASPRPHASLTSLCTVENFNSASPSSSSSLASPKSSCKITTTATAENKKSSRSVKTPNKWDAVMHKIASNKSTIKTNYNDVKSKVSTTRNMAGSGSGSGSGAGTGASAPRSPSTSSGSPRISPTVRRSPSGTPLVKRSGSVRPTNATPTTSTSTRQPQDKGSVGVGAGVGVNVFARLSKSQSPTSPTAAATAAAAAAAKRLQPVLVKRGRSYSKDSQKSSHSDLSSLCNGNGSGSPKLLAKTPLRSAKKRDVRNLSISPTDLGPPPKTQQTVKGQSTRNKSLTPTPITIQKRSQSNIGATPTPATTTTTTKTPSTATTTTTTTIATPTGNKGVKTSPQKAVKNAAGNAVIKNLNATKTLPAGIPEDDDDNDNDDDDDDDND